MIDDWRRQPLAPLDGVGLAVAAATFWWLAGPVGLVAAGGVTVTRAVLPSAHATAVGVVAATALVPAPTVRVLPVAAALLVVLVAPVAGRRDGIGVAAGTVVGTLALAAVVLGTLAATDRRWLAALTVALVGALASYLLHRYALLRLGLVEGAA